mmetsp:Transcript_20203/g.48071  ORF Transcript_20203/g.48071 Transcript_20203/m.48071 type:complete len:461 (-) Transcript_20203:198-1580(-)
MSGKASASSMMMNKRDRSDSLDRYAGEASEAFTDGMQSSSPSRLHELVWESENFLPGSRERQESLEQIHHILSKKMRDGPGPNSYKQNDGDILEAYYNNDAGMDGEGGSLGGFGEGMPFEQLEGMAFGKRGGDMNAGFFEIDDLGASEQALSNSFKESMSFTKDPESHIPSFMQEAGRGKKGKGGAGSAAMALAAGAAGTSPPVLGAGESDDERPGGAAAVMIKAETPAPAPPPKTSAAAMLAHPPSSAAMAAAMPAAAALSAGLVEEGSERLSHKEVEQRRREKAKQYFDELRALLPCGADSKFDKNTILQNTIAMIKQLQAELDNHRELREAKMGGKRGVAQATSTDYRSSFEVTRQPLCFCGLDGCVWESNSALCSLLGYTKQEMAGLSLLNSTAACDCDASSQHWQRLISSGMCHSDFYCHLVRKDQQQLMVNIDLNLIHKRNQPYCFLVATNPTS